MLDAIQSLCVERIEHIDRINRIFNNFVYFHFCQRYGRACTENANGLDGIAGGLLLFTDADKQLILDVHNEKRNMVALGQLRGFDSASRMATVVSVHRQTTQFSSFM